MIDFRALINRTPEEKAAAAARVEEAERELNEREAALIAERSETVRQLVALLPDSVSMTAWDRSFISSMALKLERFDHSGRLGGELAALTERQVCALATMRTRHLTSQAPAQGAQSAEHAERPRS